MKRMLLTASLALAIGSLATAPAAAQSPYVDPCPRPPIGGPTSPRIYTGARYSFYQPSFYSSSYYQPSYSQPYFYTSHYPKPGPYWYTPTHAFTPTYYNYYYSPGYFRY